MITMKIYNNSGSIYRFMRRNNKVLPVIEDQQHYRVDGLTPVDLELWKEELEFLKGSGDFSLTIIDHVHGTCISWGNLYLDPDEELGKTNERFASVVVNGDIIAKTPAEPYYIHTALLNVRGDMNPRGNSEIFSSSGFVSGEFYADENCTIELHNMTIAEPIFSDDCIARLYNCTILDQLLINDDVSADLNGVTVLLNLVSQAGVSINADNLFVTGNFTTGGATVVTKNLRLTGTLTGAVSNTALTTVP